jgi:Serpin (serine protease inhibitor)
VQQRHLFGRQLLQLGLLLLAVAPGAGAIARLRGLENSRVGFPRRRFRRAQIPELFPQGSINTLTRLVLANAVFFHGDWKTPFLKNSPTETFHAASGETQPTSPESTARTISRSRA